MRVVNLAHGAFAMIGGYLASYATMQMGLRLFRGDRAGGSGHDADRLAAGAVALPAHLRQARIDASADDGGHRLRRHRDRQLSDGPDAEDDPIAADFGDPGRSRFPQHRRASACSSSPAASSWSRRCGSRSNTRLWASNCAPRSKNPTWRAPWACAPMPISSAATSSRRRWRRSVVRSGAEFLPIEPFYALRYIVTFLVVVSVGGAGSILGSLYACLLARRDRRDGPLSRARFR